MGYLWGFAYTAESFILAAPLVPPQTSPSKRNKHSCWTELWSKNRIGFFFLSPHQLADMWG